MKKTQLIALLGIGLIILIVVSACGNNGGGSEKTTGDNSPNIETNNTTSNIDLTPVKNKIDKYSQLPTFIEPGPSFNAKKVMEGKKVLSIPLSSSVPFISGIIEREEAIAKEIGFEYEVWENEGQVTQWAQGIEYGISQNVDLISLVGGADPATLGPQIQKAKKAGIEVMSTHVRDFTQETPNVDFNMPTDFNMVGKILADWVILQTQDKKANVLVITSNEVVSAKPLIDGIEEEFKTYAPDAELTFVNVPVADWASKIQSIVGAQLNSNPDLNYIIPIYDGMTQGVIPAITAARASEKVKIATFNGTPFVLQYIQEGKVEMNIGEDINYIAMASMDNVMRLAGGLEPIEDQHMPFYIWDESNVNNAGTPPQLDKGYGDSATKGYYKLWELTE